MKPTILILDDDKNTLEGLKAALSGNTYTVLTTDSAIEALQMLDDENVDLILSDLKMPEMSGLELTKKIKTKHPETIVILLTAYGTIETAVEAMQLGAFDFLTKPVNLDAVEFAIKRALASKQIQDENKSLREALDKRFGFENIIGVSNQMKQVFETVRQVAPSKATVLIEGESGTGKELIARAIHQHSPRKNKSFIAVHCAALAEGILESELFGHEKGAFTGAMSRKPGRFELADGGTLFLDEISEITPQLQVKLLRVLQEKTFERLGGTQSIQTDVRLIAATNKNLEQMVREGTFREDLYYRLKVISIKLAPLRERREDIPVLVRTFLKEFSQENNRPNITLTPKVLEILNRYSWPGNVRELRNCIESMVVLAQENTLTPKEIPSQIREAISGSPSLELEKGITLEEAEKKLILNALKETENNKTLAANKLGISRRTLHRKLNEYKIT